MNLRAVGAEARYIIRSWSRSGSHVVLSLLMPLMLLLGLGFVFGAGAGDAPLLHVVDLDGSEASQLVVARLQQGGVVDVSEAPADAADRGLQDGAAALLILPRGFGNATAEAPPSLLLRDERSLEGRAVKAEVSRALGTAPEVEPATASLPPPPRYAVFLLPGVVGLSTLTTGMSVGFASISELRHAGLLQRLAASPLRKHEWLLGRMLGVGLVSLASVVVLLLVARVAFGPAFTIGLWTLPLVLGGTLVFAGLGTLLGLAVERPESGAAVLNLALLPLVLLSGAFFDLSGTPAALQTVARLSPLTHLIDGLRADMLPGAATGAASAIAILAFGAVLLATSGRLIRWTERA